MFKQCTLRSVFQGVIALYFICLVFAPVVANEKPKFIAIIMDDLGSNLVRGEQLVQLQAQLTYSFLPHTPHAKHLATLAYTQGKEVMLHLPMEPLSDKAMGPGGLTWNMNQAQFSLAVRKAILAIPHAKGVNNHMGSLLTGSLNKMNWLMREIKSTGDFYFVDSRTHKDTVAEQMAKSHSIETTARDIFLDHKIEKEAIDKQFERLIKQANETGHALAIAHPHSQTIDALLYWLDIIESEGIELVPVSQYIRLLKKPQRQNTILQASLAASNHPVIP